MEVNWWQGEECKIVSFVLREGEVVVVVVVINLIS